MKILYIEDDKRLAKLVRSLLKTNGYEVEHFALGEAGLVRFYEAFQVWDAAIVDLDLPDVPGSTLIPEIAALRPNLPIVVFSGTGDLRNRWELYPSGDATPLSKPTSGKDLLDVVKCLIESPHEPIG